MYILTCCRNCKVIPKFRVGFLSSAEPRAGIRRIILIPFKTVGLVLIIAYHYPKIKKGFINVNEISFDIFE